MRLDGFGCVLAVVDSSGLFFMMFDGLLWFWLVLMGFNGFDGF